MMSLFRKITETVSKGVTTATEKAQQTVEITRLHTQISAKRKDVDKLLHGIGEIVFASYQTKDRSETEAKVMSACEEIAAIQSEIDTLEDRILQLRNEKECVCGKKVPFDTRFCPSCGHAFPEPEVASDPLIPQSSVSVDPIPDEESDAERIGQDAPQQETPDPVAASESDAEADPDAEAPACAGCGAALVPSARFCPSCGRPQG